MSDAINLACLLCGSKALSIRESLTADEILRLWSRIDHNFSEESILPLLDEKNVHLYRCRNCGFEFFNPKLAGGAAFYEQLEAQGQGYYAPDRPENERNARFAAQQGFRTILDVGCGTGFALDAAKHAGLETYGIELSRTAAEAARMRGHTIFPTLLEQMDSKWNGKFDIISINQVLEHVPAPVQLVKDCIRLLAPRGVIAIAVPSATGILRFTPWLQANWPPHHVSRWRRKDFYTLAKAADLRVTKTGGNHLLGSEIETTLIEHYRDCVALGKSSRGPAPIVSKFIAFVYRKTGLKYIFRSQGHSIYCYLAQS